MIISAIAAIGEQRELGKANTLLFKIPEDFQRMKNLTMGHPIIMGRKTFESIGRPLPGRLNIVVSHSISFNQKKKFPGVLFFSSLDAAVSYAKEQDKEEIFIFGGGQIYQQALPLTHRLYLTVVKGNYEADTFFPDYSEFTKVLQKEERHQEGYEYTFLTLERP